MSLGAAPRRPGPDDARFIDNRVPRERVVSRLLGWGALRGPSGRTAAVAREVDMRALLFLVASGGAAGARRELKLLSLEVGTYVVDDAVDAPKAVACADVDGAAPRRKRDVVSSRRALPPGLDLGRTRARRRRAPGHPGGLGGESHGAL